MEEQAMDPISLILAALVAGAAAGAKDTASSAIKDAYQGLKAVIRRRWGDNPAAEAELQNLENTPAADHSALAAQLEALGAGGDEELLLAAQKVFQQAGKYNIVMPGAKGVAVGDHQTTIMNFNN
jgi:hypothetical protein